MSAPRIPAFLNPSAGSAAAAREAMVEAGLDVRDCEPHRLTQLVQGALADGHRRIVVAGGDGSIAAAAAALVSTDVELAIVPGGTLNHYAKDHGIPDDLAEAAQLAIRGEAVPTDVAKVNDRVFLNTSTVGAYIALVRHRDDLESVLGYRISTLVASIRALLGMRAFDLELEVEGTARHYRTPLLFVGVGERELRIPILGKRVDEGRHALHLLVPRGHGRRALLALAIQAITRGTAHVTRSPELDGYLVDRCTVRLRRRGPVGLDGEIVQLDTPLVYRFLPGALRVVTGPPAERTV